MSLRGICATVLVLEGLSMGGFLGVRFGLDPLFGGTVIVLPGLLLADLAPTRSDARPLTPGLVC